MIEYRWRHTPFALFSIIHVQNHYRKLLMHWSSENIIVTANNVRTIHFFCDDIGHFPTPTRNSSSLFNSFSIRQFVHMLLKNMHPVNVNLILKFVSTTNFRGLKPEAWSLKPRKVVWAMKSKGGIKHARILSIHNTIECYLSTLWRAQEGL